MKVKKKPVVGTIFIIILCAVIMMPFAIMLIGALKPNAALITIPMDLNPFRNMTLKNVMRVLQKSDIFLWLKNSLIISLGVTFGTVVVGLTGGYAMARIKFPLKGLLFALVMATMMMPKQMLMVPNYLVAQALHLVNSRIGVILTTIAPAFGVFLSRQFISSLPGELFDAAEIDGCGEFRKFLTVALPLSTPAIGTVSIFAFIAAFNDYIWQLIMLSDKSLKTLPLGIQLFASINDNNKAVQLAMALVATIPLIILFLACQKLFIKGATAGAVKG